MKKYALLGLLGFLSMFPGSAKAAIPFNIPVNGGWYTFDFGDAGFEWSHIFNFTADLPVQVTVTDLFLSGDQFLVRDFNTDLGLTSLPASVGDQVNLDFNKAVADPRWSTGFFNLTPGAHSINGIAVLSPFGNGTPRGGGSGALRVDAIPEPSTLVSLGLALTGLFGFGRRFSQSKNAV